MLFVSPVTFFLLVSISYSLLEVFLKCLVTHCYLFIFLHGETKKPVGTYVCEEWGLIIGENSCTVVACWVSHTKRPLLILQMLAFGSLSYLGESHLVSFRGCGWWEKWRTSLCQLSHRPTTQLADLTQDPCFEPCITPSPLSGGSKPLQVCRAKGLTLHWKPVFSPSNCKFLAS